ncbi:MAG: hypothetical protein ACP5QK_02755 [Myxococcota bacterium]
MKRFSFFLLFFLFLSGCSRSNELNIIYSSDMWGETSHCGCPGHPTGGLPRKASFIKEVRKNYRGVYYFELGDTFFKPGVDSEQARSQSQMVDMFVDAFNKMGLDVFVPGEVDLRMGVDFLEKKVKRGDFKTLLSNLVKKDKKETVFDRVYIDKRYGKKVCVFALISKDLYKSDEYEVLEPVSTAKQILSEFEKSGCEFNILLSHLGYSNDINFLKDMADSKLNLLIGSHDGGWMSAPRKDGNVLTVYGYRRGQAVGHIGFIGSLKTQVMKDATQSVENGFTIKRFEKELNKLLEPTKGKSPEEFYKNDSTTLMKVKMLSEQIAELKKNSERNLIPPYYFNRVVSMDTAYEDDKEIEGMVKEAEGRVKR